jgi:hypothetical protein
MKLSRKLSLTILVLFSPSFAEATTRVASPPPKSSLACNAKVLFLHSERTQEDYNFRERAQVFKKVFWRIRILDVDNASLCPSENEIQLRVRGASFREESISYPIGIKEPKADLRLNIRFTKISGIEARTKKPYSEWTLQKVESLE